MFDASRLAHPHLCGLEAYVPGKQPEDDGWIKLNTNESPYPAPAAVKAAIVAECGRLSRYPSPVSARLREAISARFGLETEQVIIGNGSDDILNLLMRAFGGNDRRTAETTPSYSLYPVLAALTKADFRSVAFSENFQLPVDELLTCSPRLLFLTCPNAPTGVRFPLSDIRRLADGLRDGLLVVDEAYADFADENASSLLASHPQVFITRTFSKAYGLAGLRVGFGMGDASVIRILDKIRDSYNVNRLSQAGALAALHCQAEIDQQIRQIRQTRDRVAAALRSLNWHVYPSEANFLFGAPVAGSGKIGSPVAESLFETLLANRILVRRFPSHPLTAPYLRISVGTDQEMDQFLTVVRQWTNHA